MDYNPGDQTHVVLVNMGTADEACEPLPLVEYPDAYQVGVGKKWKGRGFHRCSTGAVGEQLLHECREGTSKLA